MFKLNSVVTDRFKAPDKSYHRLNSSQRLRTGKISARHTPIRPLSHLQKMLVQQGDAVK